MTFQANVLTNTTSANLSDETTEQILASIDAMLSGVEDTETIARRVGEMHGDPADAICSGDEIENKMMESPQQTELRRAHFAATGAVPQIPGFDDLYSNGLVGAPKRCDYAERNAAFEAELDAECAALFARLTR